MLLTTIFAKALLSSITIDILHVNTEEIQFMSKQIRAADGLAITEVGLKEPFAEVRADSSRTTSLAGVLELSEEIGQ